MKKPEKIYIGTSKKNSKEITLKELLMDRIKFKDKSLKLESGVHGDNSGSWLNLVKTLDKERVQFTVVLSFETPFKDEEPNMIIDDANLFKADIITIIDEERQKKLF